MDMADILCCICLQNLEQLESQNNYLIGGSKFEWSHCPGAKNLFRPRCPGMFFEEHRANTDTHFSQSGLIIEVISQCSK